MTASDLRPFDQRRRIRGLRALGLLLVPLVLVVRPAWPSDGWAAAAMEVAGTLLLVVAVLGRFWAILYVGGRKNREVVTDGPYSVCRHPLYLFSTLSAAAFGLLLGSLALALGLAVVVGLILWATAAREEAWLRHDLGPAYRAYEAAVPRLWPQLSLFRTPPEVLVAVGPLRNNLADALALMALLPAAKLLATMRLNAWAMMALP